MAAHGLDRIHVRAGIPGKSGGGNAAVWRRRRRADKSESNATQGGFELTGFELLSGGHWASLNCLGSVSPEERGMSKLSGWERAWPLNLFAE